MHYVIDITVGLFRTKKGGGSNQNNLQLSSSPPHILYLFKFYMGENIFAKDKSCFEFHLASKHLDKPVTHE